MCRKENEKKKGACDMAVLAKPIGRAFDLDPKKETAFLNAAKTTNSLTRALARSKRHQPKTNKK